MIGLNDLIAKKRKKKGKKESNCPQNKMCCYKVWKIPRKLKICKFQIENAYFLKKNRKILKQNLKKLEKLKSQENRWKRKIGGEKKKRTTTILIIIII